MAKPPTSRTYTYNIDNASFAMTAMPELRRRVEERVYPLAKERGLQVRVAEQVVKTELGHPVGGVNNLTWRARNGLAPGFTVRVEHDARNYLKVKVDASAFYPTAALFSFLLGLVISYFWMPYLVSHWRELTSNLLFIGLVVVMWILLIAVTRTLIVSAILAILSTFLFGFILGYVIGWGIGAALGNRKHGDKVRPALIAIIEGLDQPSSQASTSQQLADPGSAPARSRPWANSALPHPGAARGTIAPLPPLALPVPSQHASAPAAAVPVPPAAPCPKCGAKVVFGAPWCVACGQNLAWG